MNINPLTGKPWSNFNIWAKKQIFDKTYVRIKALESAVSTGPKIIEYGTPKIDKIRNIRKLEFFVEENHIDLKNAVFNEIQQLEKEFPNWKFSAKFGK
ncbi:MAG: hypothetical protein QM535_20165 [Limnohabitans sp.]|nr:hypothetical protein [Limnohabitans sp.]